MLSTRTRLVAVTAASNLFGTRPDVAGDRRAAHEVDALVYVDGVHLTAARTGRPGRARRGLLACSPYKFFGPHLGALAASPALLERLAPDKLVPSSDAVPERFELGTLPYELLAGVTAGVDFIADLAPGDATGPARPRHGVDDRRRGARGEAVRPAADRAAPASRGDPARPPRAAYPHSAVLRRGAHRSARSTRRSRRPGVNAPASNFYAIEASRHAGLGDDGAVRAGIAPYTTADDVDRLVAGVAAL